MTLDELRPGQSAFLCRVGGTGALRRHLLDMGLTPGTEVRLQKTAPMGDPIQIALRGYTLTLRLEDARQLVLQPVPPPPVPVPVRRPHRLADPAVPDASRPDPSAPLTFALVGNQNCGKTTLFNQLTGADQHVGNFPGVTVDRKDGVIRNHPEATVTDLPGIYSLSPYSSEERLTREFLLKEGPSAIINIVDATNLERNLYLTLQLLELEIPMVLALNMMDEVRANGGAIRTDRLEAYLGIPVVPISAARNQGIDALIDRALSAARTGQKPPRIDLRPENDGPDQDAAIAGIRFRFLEALCQEVVVRPHESREHRRSDAIDRILTGKYTAMPCFFGLLALVFALTFGPIGGTLSDLMELGLDWTVGTIDRALTLWQVAPILRSLVVDGICTGIASVLHFLPTIVTLFFFLSILEDSGYMARAAFLMDRPLRRLGLSGKSFVPLLMGFGCSVPAILATRTLPSERDRRMTVLLIPFMSCSAKLPVYTVLVAAFFPRRIQVLVMIGLYLLGILCGILFAILLNRIRFSGPPVPFVLELPNYRMPSAKSVVRLLWEKAKGFVQRAFTAIFLTSVLIWLLQAFNPPLHVAAGPEQSLLAHLGGWLAPIFRPLGFGNWQSATALLTGFTAKESMVSTLTLLSGGDPRRITALFTPGTAVVFLVFTLLYTPCIAAISTIRQELGRSRAALIAILQCTIAWIIAFLVRCILLILGLL